MLKMAEQGCDVAVHYGSSEDEASEVAEQVKAHGRSALLFGGEVSSAEDVRRIAGEIEDHYGRVDILLNNAGSIFERATLEDMTVEAWDRVMDVNLKSIFLCSQAVLPIMRRQGGGRIVNMSSVVARDGGSASSFAYAVAKGGVSTLTRSMAKQLVSDGIMVNAGAPGRIDTPFHDKFTSDEKGRRRRRRYRWGGKELRKRSPKRYCSSPLPARHTFSARSSR